MLEEENLPHHHRTRRLPSDWTREKVGRRAVPNAITTQSRHEKCQTFCCLAFSEHFDHLRMRPYCPVNNLKRERRILIASFGFWQHRGIFTKRPGISLVDSRESAKAAQAQRDFIKGLIGLLSSYVTPTSLLDCAKWSNRREGKKNEWARLDWHDETAIGNATLPVSKGRGKGAEKGDACYDDAWVNHHYYYQFKRHDKRKKKKNQRIVWGFFSSSAAEICSSTMVQLSLVFFFLSLVLVFELFLRESKA